VALNPSGDVVHHLPWHARIALAEELLVDGSASATEIALALGFSDSAHFSRRFTRAAGVSPAEFRRRRQ